MAEKVFVSPGVYTSEKDLSFVTRQVGVTTLGLVGETTQGPAFQPIFVSNYDEFRSFFGGCNPTRIKDNGAPKYELPYIAKSYLSQSNHTFPWFLKQIQMHRQQPILNSLFHSI